MAMTQVASQVASATRTRVRYEILAMIFVVTTFNYVDRATLSVAAPAMRAELGFDAVTMGLAFSAFGWSYTALQIPGGWLLDRHGSRIIYGCSLIGWSVFTFCQGYVDRFTSPIAALFALRLLMGAAETPTFPANSRLTVLWFPDRERGFATATFQSAQYFALAAFTPLMAWILTVSNWHAIFFCTGAAGVMLGLYWFAFAREPQQHPRVNAAELSYIAAGGGLPKADTTRSRIRWTDVRLLLTSRMLIGIYVGNFCLTTISWFFLTWFPTYLVEARGMSFLKVGFVAAIPAVAGFTGGIVGGIWSDWLLRRGGSLTFARKLPIVTGLVLSSTIVAANYAASDVLVVTIMSIALFAKGVGNLGWCVNSDVAPPAIMGLSGSVFNLYSNLAGIVTPLLIGVLVGQTGNFDIALIYIAAMALLGAVSYLVIVGPLHRISMPDSMVETS